jgi:4-carboxymuconolactone decarboxylase
MRKEGIEMSTSKERTAAQKMIGDFAPILVELTDEVLFGDVWERKELSPRDRSLITVSCLITSGNTEQLAFHLNKAKENGLSEEQLIEAITHLAFYAGWPKSMSAIMVAKEVFSKGK